jgi:hypothetical protein
MVVYKIEFLKFLDKYIFAHMNCKIKYPNGLNLYGNVLSYTEYYSLYHVIKDCQLYNTRINKRDNERFVEEILTYVFNKNR